MTAVFPAFETEVACMDDFSGAALSRFYEHLDALAEQNNVATLTSFLDNRTMIDEYLADEFDLPDIPAIEWHSSSEGLKTVRVLLNAVEECSEHFGVATEELLGDLRGLETLLAGADARGVRFHLLLDI